MKEYVTIWDNALHTAKFLLVCSGITFIFSMAGFFIHIKENLDIRTEFLVSLFMPVFFLVPALICLGIWKVFSTIKRNIISKGKRYDGTVMSVKKLHLRNHTYRYTVHAEGLGMVKSMEYYSPIMDEECYVYVLGRFVLLMSKEKKSRYRSNF